MADDTIPQDDPRPLTVDERYKMFADWSDYRKSFGVSADERQRQREFGMFTAGWQMAYTRAELESTDSEEADRG